MADSDHSRISDEEVGRIARLARLRLTDEEAQRMKQDMDAILGYVAKLADLELDDVPPTAHAVDMGLALFDDVPREHLGAERALRDAPAAEEGHFLVPRVL